MPTAPQPPTPRPLAAWRRAYRSDECPDGLTQAQLAKLAGVALDTIVNVEKQHAVPSLATAIKLSRALGVPVESVDWPTPETVTPPESRRNRYQKSRKPAQP